jgi:hypothetical protein
VELWLSERYRRSFQSSALAGLSIARAGEKRLGGKAERRRREDEERESRRRLEQDDQEQKEQQQQEQQEGDGEGVRRRRRTMGFKEFGDHVGSQFSGTMGGVLPEEEGFPTGLWLEMAVEMERMDLTEKERTIKSAIASGTLLAALKRTGRMARCMKGSTLSSCLRRVCWSRRQRLRSRRSKSYW